MRLSVLSKRVSALGGQAVFARLGQTVFRLGAGVFKSTVAHTIVAPSAPAKPADRSFSPLGRLVFHMAPKYGDERRRR